MLKHFGNLFQLTLEVGLVLLPMMILNTSISTLKEEYQHQLKRNIGYKPEKSSTLKNKRSDKKDNNNNNRKNSNKIQKGTM